MAVTALLIHVVAVILIGFLMLRVGKNVVMGGLIVRRCRRVVMIRCKLLGLVSEGKNYFDTCKMFLSRKF